MGEMVRPEEIYDAVTDDAAFAALATTLAEASNARSGVLHWRGNSDEPAEISLSGYFPDEQMSIYDHHFADSDLWSHAADNRERINRATNFTLSVPDHVYERSQIYNDWIRPMGDDTFYCLGGVIQFHGIRAHLGFHRGRKGKAFSASDVRKLQASFPHLGRMFELRSKLSRASMAQQTLQTTLDAVGQAIFTLRLDGRFVHCNADGEVLLKNAGQSLELRRGFLVARNVEDDRMLQAAFRLAARSEGAEGSVLSFRKELGGPDIISLAAVSNGMERQIVLIVSGPLAAGAEIEGPLRSLYGLTRAEVGVTIGLAQGKTLEQIALERGVRLHTVRSQSKSIYAKLECNRQAELVARIVAFPRMSRRG